jgi:hypothetical protein
MYVATIAFLWERALPAISLSDDRHSRAEPAPTEAAASRAEPAPAEGQSASSANRNPPPTTGL